MRCFLLLSLIVVHVCIEFRISIELLHIFGIFFDFWRILSKFWNDTRNQKKDVRFVGGMHAGQHVLHVFWWWLLSSTRNRYEHY